jgi:3-carboxy-cis,cis-muconate cycloisomerase
LTVSSGLFDALFSTAKMADIMSDRGRVQAMLDFEAALARAEARVGVIPRDAAPAIAAQCRAERFDFDALANGAGLAGNLAIPLVKALTARVEAVDADAGKYVHWGATSQDAIDTGLVLQLRDVVKAVEEDLTRLSHALTALSRSHRLTPLAGRTWLQQATPVTLGLKAAGWLSAIERHRARLGEMRSRLLVVQFGGASGTLASLGTRGVEVMLALGDELNLGLPDLPWHTHRDRVAEAATTLGLLVGTLGKMAKDVSLLMQTEIGEAFEPAAAGKGGSSTMPHKRNPVGCAAVLAAALRVPALVSVMLTAMVQEHERGMGSWHAEWQTLPEIATLCGGALAQMIQVAEGLEVDATRMLQNLDVTRGLILAEAVTMALGPHIGRLQAHHLVETACRRAVVYDTHLREVLRADAEVRKYLSAEDIERLLDPANYVGMSGVFVDRVLASIEQSPHSE